MLDPGGGRLPFLERPLPPSFELREITVAPGDGRPYDPRDWDDALVVVERGEIELECRTGARRSFGTGSILWLAGLPVRRIRNRGGEAARLVAVSRRWKKVQLKR